MDLSPDMVRDQPDDPFAIGGRHPAPRIGNPRSQPVDPEPTVGIEHDLDDRRIIEPKRDLWSKCRAQHARTTRGCFGPDRDDAHEMPLVLEAIHNRLRSRGRAKGHQIGRKQQLVLVSVVWRKGRN